MTPLTLKQTVETYLATNWTRFPIRLRNKKTDLNGTIVDISETHGVLDFTPAPVTSLEILGATDRTGVFTVQVFTPLNVGTDEAWSHAGHLELLFRNGTLGDIAFEPPPYSRDAGKDDELQMYQINVVVPFEVITD